MNYVTEYLFVFAVCSTLGWICEVIYRSIVEKRMVNPGFMSGCCLPIYGTGGVILYTLTAALSQISAQKVTVGILMFIIGMVIMTAVEFIGGYFLMTYYHTRLWDYTNSKFNYKGIICLSFSLCWGFSSVGYYFLVDPWLRMFAQEITMHTLCVLLIGVYYGVFFVDLAESLNLMQKIKEHANNIKQTVDVEQLKTSAKEYINNKLKKPKSLFMFNSHSSLSSYLNNVKTKTEELIEKIKQDK